MAEPMDFEAKSLSDEQLRGIFERLSDVSSDYDNDSTIDEDYDPRKEKDDGESESDTDDDPQLAVGENQHVDVDNIRKTARLHKRTGKVLTRKRNRDPSSWKCNIRKKLRQSGKQYTDSRGKEQEARSVKTKKDCSKCKFKCSLNISENDRSAIFNEFWTMSDDEKMHFYGKTTNQTPTQRGRKFLPSRKQNSLSYCLPCQGKNIRVCKVFYLTTLSISHRRVCTYHHSKRAMGGTPVGLQWGKNANNVVPQEIKTGIRDHINSIPRVQSHYCRASTNKEYFSSGLSISLLYEKYVEKCKDTGRTPGKLHMYREIFNSFNIAFHVPKKDRCDACEAMKMNREPTEEQKKVHDEHLKGKLETKEERDKDRHDKNTLTVCFDLQNVFALPTAEISNFFYRRKLNVYHMTAHCSADKRGYGAVWHEAQNGRSGNDIASSVIKLLDAVVKENVDDPRIKHITLWSDSCVPQNRNSIFSTAIKVFLKHHPQVLSIVHKFCEPGHSAIQEVDNLHSQIEQVCRNSEIYSPVGLLRMLKKVHRSKPLKLIQMIPEDFRDFQEIAKQGQYQQIPFTKVKCLMFKQKEPKVVKYKKHFSDDWIFENVIERNTRIGTNDMLFVVPDPKLQKQVVLPQAKKDDIKAMLKFMPPGQTIYVSCNWINVLSSQRKFEIPSISEKLKYFNIFNYSSYRILFDSGYCNTSLYCWLLSNVN